MSAAFDDRLVTFQIFLPDESFTYDENFYISATGTRYTSENWGECAIRLDNISKTARNDLIAKTTPWNTQRSLANVILSVGRKSYGTFQIFNGAMTACNVTQPPDIGLMFQSTVGAATWGFSNAFSMPPLSTVQSICQYVATSLSNANPNNPLTLDFKSTQANKNVANFSYTGSVNNLVAKLNELGDIKAFVQGNRLVIRDANGPPESDPVIEINKGTGMIGVPQISQSGITVKTLILNDIQLYSKVNVTSYENPMANGTWYVNGMNFEVASRDTPFYFTLDLWKYSLGAPGGVSNG